MRNIVLALASALALSAAQAAPKHPRKHVHRQVAASPALPGTFHFGPDSATGKWTRLSDQQVAPRSAGTAELEHNARRDGTNQR